MGTIECQGNLKRIIEFQMYSRLLRNAVALNRREPAVLKDFKSRKGNKQLLS